LFSVALWISAKCPLCNVEFFSFFIMTIMTTNIDKSLNEIFATSTHLSTPLWASSSALLDAHKLLV
jgi:hypothetical protein